MEQSNSLALSAHSIVDPAFCLKLVLGDKASGTIRSYNTAYSDFTSFALNMSGDPAQKEVDHGKIVDVLTKLVALEVGQANAMISTYRNDMLARKMKPATVNCYLSALRSYIGEARRCGLITWDIDVKNSRQKKYRDTAGPGHENYVKMICAAIGRSDAKGNRDLAILRLLYDVGLRRKEVAGLNLDDLDFERECGEGCKGGVSVIFKRYCEPQWIGLPGPTMAAVQAWIESRGREPGPLFVNLDIQAQNSESGRRLGATSIYKMVRAIAKKVGVLRPVSPHRLRHGGATRAAKLTNGNAVALLAWGRWSNLNTANLYCDKEKNLGGMTAALVAGD